MPATPSSGMASTSPNILIRLVWFLAIGWWLGGVVSAIAWFMIAIVIGLPFGLWLINRLPTIITLRAQEQQWYLQDGSWRQGQSQYNFVFRALYFLVIGWWFSAIWMAVAYIAVILIVTIPIAFWMYGRVGAVTTLYRS